MIIGGFWLPKAGFDVLSLSIQRPESVAEHVLRVVLSFDLYESVPVLAETGFGFTCGVAAAKELKEVLRDYN